MRFTDQNVARTLKAGYAAYATSNLYDGVSAVTIDPDGRVRSLLPIPAGYHQFALAAELGGRAMNLLYPSPGVCCIHGRVKYDPADPACRNVPGSYCACGQEPVDRNPEKRWQEACS